MSNKFKITWSEPMTNPRFKGARLVRTGMDGREYELEQLVADLQEIKELLNSKIEKGIKLKILVMEQL